ncbi:MAG: hypothetical protein HYU64_09000 [Armatimonadetes bacterium]|nr:hypothetical protein [Armatimonadota bacterium]
MDGRHLQAGMGAVVGVGRVAPEGAAEVEGPEAEEALGLYMVTVPVPWAAPKLAPWMVMDAPTCPCVGLNPVSMGVPRMVTDPVSFG